MTLNNAMALVYAELLQDFCRESNNCSDCVFWVEDNCVLCDNNSPVYWLLDDCEVEIDETD